jgi:hypothetical protein
MVLSEVTQGTASLVTGLSTALGATRGFGGGRSASSRRATHVSADPGSLRLSRTTRGRIFVLPSRTEWPSSGGWPRGWSASGCLPVGLHLLLSWRSRHRRRRARTSVRRVVAVDYRASVPVARAASGAIAVRVYKGDQALGVTVRRGHAVVVLSYARELAASSGRSRPSNIAQSLTKQSLLLKQRMRPVTRRTLARTMRHPSQVTRDVRRRQLPTVTSHAVPTGEYQSDPPSLPADIRCSSTRAEPSVPTEP